MADEVETMFSGNRQIPWHKKGNVVEGVLTSAEAIVAAGLDWAVRKIPMLVPALDDNPEPIFVKRNGKYVPAPEQYRLVDEVPDKFGVQRLTDGSVLGGWMGTEYCEFQNVEAFELFDFIVGDGEAKYETAGALFEGRQIFILARLNRNITIDGDKTIPYLLLTTSHDGSAALRMLSTPVRVVCANTMRLAFSDHKSDWSARHTTNMKSKVAEARQALKIGGAYYDEFEKEINRLMNQEVSRGQIDKFLGKVFPRKNSDALNEKALGVRGLLESSPTIGKYKDTAWGLLNATNEFETWVSPMQNEAKRVERQAKDVISGQGFAATKAMHSLLVAARPKVAAK